MNYLKLIMPKITDSASRVSFILMTIATIAFTYLRVIPSDIFISYSSLAFMHFFNKSTSETLTKTQESVTIDDRG